MRAEDIAARIGVARYAVLLPMTSDANARVASDRFRETIRQLTFNIGGETIGLSLAAGYTAADIAVRQDGQELLQQAESALQQAVACTDDDKVASFVEHDVNQQQSACTEDDIRRAMQHVIDGAYDQVPDHMLHAVAERLTPFLDYVAGQTDTGRTGTDHS